MFSRTDFPDDREWIRSIWNKWFDDVYPPTPPDSDSDEDLQEQEEQLNVLTAHEKTVKRLITCYTICLHLPHPLSVSIILLSIIMS